MAFGARIVEGHHDRVGQVGAGKLRDHREDVAVNGGPVCLARAVGELRGGRSTVQRSRLSKTIRSVRAKSANCFLSTRLPINGLTT